VWSWDHRGRGSLCSWGHVDLGAVAQKVAALIVQAFVERGLEAATDVVGRPQGLSGD
jgi:hypothetical protein